MPDENVFEPGDTLNFTDPDQTRPEYNPGIVTAALGTTVIGGPDNVSLPFAVTNTVLRDDTNLRGTDYTVFQELVEAKSGGSTYSRTATPGQNKFGDWVETSFDSESYYTKTETDALVGGVEGALSHESGIIKLTQSNSGESTVPLVGVGGIAIASGVNGITIDGTALTPTPQFLGVLQDTQNPTALHPTPNDGEYWLYGYTGKTVGTDPADQDCTPGDWCIYNTDKWVHLDLSQDPGVVDVNVNGGLLTVDKTTASQPDIGLDLADIINDTNLDEYAKKEYVDALTLGDLDNVDTSGAVEGQSLVYDSAEDEWVPGAAIGEYLPLSGGTMKGDIELDGNSFLQNGFKYIDLATSSPQLRTASGSSLKWTTIGGDLNSGGAVVATWRSSGIEMASGKAIKLKTEGTEDDHVVTKAYVDSLVDSIELETPFIGSVFWDISSTGTFPDRSVPAFNADVQSYLPLGTQMYVSSQLKSKNYQGPSYTYDWPNEVSAGDVLLFAAEDFSTYFLVTIQAIVMNSGNDTANITYGFLDGDAQYGTKYNIYNVDPHIGELFGKNKEFLKHTGDQKYTGTLNYNNGQLVVDSANDVITAGSEDDPFIAVEDHEILTLGGFKSHEEARGGFLELSGGEMTGDISFSGSGLLFKPVTPADQQGADAPGRWCVLKNDRLKDPDGNNLNQSGNVHDFGIRVDLTTGRTGYNKFQFFSNVAGGDSSRFADFGGGNDPSFRFHRGKFAMEGNRIQNLGDPTDLTDAVNKKYVDETPARVQVIPDSPADPQVGDFWYSTNTNTFVIKIA